MRRQRAEAVIWHERGGFCNPRQIWIGSVKLVEKSPKPFLIPGFVARAQEFLDHEIVTSFDVVVEHERRAGISIRLGGQEKL